jgi:hypothetical protein
VTYLFIVIFGSALFQSLRLDDNFLGALFSVCSGARKPNVLRGLRHILFGGGFRRRRNSLGRGLLRVHPTTNWYNNERLALKPFPLSQTMPDCWPRRWAKRGCATSPNEEVKKALNFACFSKLTAQIIGAWFLLSLLFGRVFSSLTLFWCFFRWFLCDHFSFQTVNILINKYFDSNNRPFRYSIMI